MKCYEGQCWRLHFQSTHRLVPSAVAQHLTESVAQYVTPFTKRPQYDGFGDTNAALVASFSTKKYSNAQISALNLVPAGRLNNRL